MASLFTTSSTDNTTPSQNETSNESSLNFTTSRAISNPIHHTNPATDSRPPLSSIILDARKHFVKQKDGGRNQTIIGDPQFLLDFAIIGFVSWTTKSAV